MQARLDTAVATGERTADLYTFSDLAVAIHEPVGEGQTSAGLVFTASGEVSRVVYDATGDELGQATEPFSSEFIMRQLAGDRWLIVAVDPPT
jgi:hypothetical protein